MNHECNEYNILDEEQMNELITVPECRQLREIISTLTMAPLIKKREFVRLMVVINDILNRMEKKNE